MTDLALFLSLLVETILLAIVWHKKKHVEKDFAESKAAFDTIFNNANPICVTNPDHEITMANRAYIDTFGPVKKNGARVKCFESRRGNCCHTGSCPLKAINEMGETALVSEMIKYLEDGTTHHFVVSSKAMRDTGGRALGLMESFQDVSAIKQFEREREKSEHLEALGVVAGGIAHDFNNLLQAIVGNLALAQLLVTNPKDETVHLLKEAEKASWQAKELTQKILTFSKGGDPMMKPTDLSEVLQRAVKSTIAQGKVSVQLDIATNLYLVDADESHLRQAVRNIVTNAEEAMPDGGAFWITAKNSDFTEIREHLGNQATPSDKYVHIALRDNGKGIPPEDLARIFDPYFSSKRRGCQKGMGLGLSTVYSIVRKHHGSIQVESAPGVGTTVHLYFPARKECVAQEFQHQQLQRPPTRRILLMDDEELVRDSAGSMLSYLHWQVELANNGEEAVALYQKALAIGSPFDFVILDLAIVGGMGGQETVVRLQQIDPSVRAIVSSGYIDDPAMADCEGHGFCAAIAKPYSLDKLQSLLQQLTENRPTITRRNPMADDRLIKKVLVALALTLAGANQVLASQHDDVSLYQMSLDELMQVEIGIASKQPETVRQAPSAVTVFTRNEIRAMGIDNVYDLLNYVPGFQTTRLIDVIDQPLIHGRGLANLNGEVLVLLNGHRLNENSLGTATRFTSVLSTANVKQVEVIRGPGSALYGSNAFLGVVNIITVNGVNDADLHAGAYDALGGHFNLAKEFGPLAANVSLSYEGDRGEKYYRGDDYPQGPDTTSDPRQDVNFYTTLALHGTTLEVGHMAHKAEDFLNFNGVAPSGDAWSDTDYTMAALSHDWTLSNAVTIKGGISFTRHEISSVGWFGPAAPNAVPPSPKYFVDRMLGPYSQNSAYEALLDLTWRIDPASDLLTGLSYRHEGTDTLGHYTNYWSDVPGLEAKPMASSYLGGTKLIEDVPSLDSREKFLDNYGLYAQYRRDLTPTLHATAGGRFDQYDVTGGTFNPRLSLIWDAMDDFTLKAFWGTAFRAPSLAELYTNSQRSLGNLDLQPETIETTELVCQKRLQNVELEAVYFHNAVADSIERTTPASATDSRQTWINGGDQNYDGIEARIIWDPVADLRFYLTHTHVFSSLAEVTYDDFSSFIVDYHPGRWRFNINGIYRDQQENGLTSQNDYLVANAKLSYAAWQTVSLYVKAENLFDYRYASVEPDISSTYFDAVPNQGLRWMLGMEATW